ncbi:hypothetical protein C1E24_08155 [Pseudoalteromonas phenolica]|uniref:Uncharacterized protein n=1 Tax=Pseudoalteromonas phenolica TaxID=161398 RepID=A0A5R9Q3D1_9GAMM|nr:hypothetical protein [Pseudoalteromonas phenolica]TLX47324.1 hypothetical protein C1E24_08155 [Pseudoalteromonas phenolica]
MRRTPSLEEEKEIYFSESSTCEDNDNLLDSYYSEKSNYTYCIEEVNRLIDACKFCIKSELQYDPLKAWQYLHEAFNEKIIFGVSKYIGNGRTYGTMHGADYIKFTKEASQLFNKISCHPDGLVFNSDINEKWLNVDRSFELICNLHNSFSSEFEKLFLDALKEDPQTDLVDLVDSLSNYPDRLTFQQRCELYKINLFDIIRLHDKAYYYLGELQIS